MNETVVNGSVAADIAAMTVPSAHSEFASGRGGVRTHESTLSHPGGMDIALVNPMTDANTSPTPHPINPAGPIADQGTYPGAQA